MAVPAPERAMQVAEVANRLRMMQIDCAAMTPQERQAFFGDVIEKALSSVVPSERGAFLEALQSKFPAWNGQTQPVAQAAAKAVDVREAPELKNPGFVLARLIELVPLLSPDDKRAVVAELHKAGLPVSAGTTGGVPEDVSRFFKDIMRFPGTQRLDPARLLALIPVLIELTCGLHQFVWTAWRTMAPNSDLRPALVSLQAAITRFAAGDPSATQDQLAKELTKLRQLAAALVAAVGETGRQFATHHCAKFSPAEIEAVVRMEGGGGILRRASEKDFWNKYKDLFGELGEETIEGEIRETISKHVELLMKGLVR